MSSAAVLRPPVSSFPDSTSPSCPRCGHSVPLSLESDPTSAHRRILDLEAQVKLLNIKAAAAVDKLADYEDEVRFLRVSLSRSADNTSPGLPPTPTPKSVSNPATVHPDR